MIKPQPCIPGHLAAPPLSPGAGGGCQWVPGCTQAFLPVCRLHRALRGGPDPRCGHQPRTTGWRSVSIERPHPPEMRGFTLWPWLPSPSPAGIQLRAPAPAQQAWPKASLSLSPPSCPPWSWGLGSPGSPENSDVAGTCVAAPSLCSAPGWRAVGRGQRQGPGCARTCSLSATATSLSASTLWAVRRAMPVPPQGAGG